MKCTYKNIVVRIKNSGGPGRVKWVAELTDPITGNADWKRGVAGDIVEAIQAAAAVIDSAPIELFLWDGDAEAILAPKYGQIVKWCAGKRGTHICKLVSANAEFVRLAKIGSYYQFKVPVADWLDNAICAHGAFGPVLCRYEWPAHWPSAEKAGRILAARPADIIDFLEFSQNEKDNT